MRRSRVRGWAAPGILAVAGLALAGQPREAAAQTPGSEAACQGLVKSGRFAGMAGANAKLVAPDAAQKTPAYCEVIATLSPVPGSKIGVVYRLPASWNRKVVGYGGGGWAGNVRIETVAADLARGYATLQTDGGHPGASAGDASWTAPGGKPDQIALNDYAWRAVHTMTDTGKAVAAAYYGRGHEKAYFQGCSSGGRMALMEAQRFPGDYDGIISGAPVYSFRVQLGEIYRDWIFAQPGAAVTEGQVRLIHDAVLANCDAQDGVKDGIVGDPKACRFDPAALACKAGQDAAQCLTPAQVQAVRRQYATVTSPKGDVLIYGYSRGSELGWLNALNITNDPQKAAHVRDLDLRAVMFGDPAFDFAAFDVQRDSPKVRAGPMAKFYEADNPDLTPFLAKGGKLILWHGLDDQLPSPWGTVGYYERATKAVGPKASQSGVRLFLAPGVAHCGGGAGPGTFDMIGALDGWVARGAAPQRIVATKTPPPRPANPFVPMSRPLCAYPAQARYLGTGDANAERSFACRPK